MSDLSDKIKRDFFPICVFVNTTVCMIYIDVNEWKKAHWKLHKNDTCYFEQIMETAHHKITAVPPLNSHLTNHPIRMNKTMLKKQGQSHERRSFMGP